MHKSIRILIVAFTCAVFTALLFLKTGTLALTLSTVTSGISGAAISALYELIDTKGQGIKTWLLSKIKYKDKDIYISFSYLYRIEVDGKYLLVRGHRLKNQYQPIGGVYKYYPEAKSFLNSIRVVPSTVMGNTDETDDLRLNMKGKYFLSFIDWFLKMEDREYDPIREFTEELLDTGILPKDEFQKLKYRKVDVHNVGFTYSQPLASHEVIYADIFELILTDDQKNIIRDAVSKYPDCIVLATPQEIKTRRYAGSVEMNLGNNTPWIIGEN